MFEIMGPITGFVVICTLILVGAILFTHRTVLFQCRPPDDRSAIEFIILLVAWFLLIVFALSLGLFPFFLIGLVIFVYLQNWRTKQQGFLWMLALASEKEIPLTSAVEAYAFEAGGAFGDKVVDFTAMLKNGVPFPDALRMTPGLVSTDRYPLIYSAYESGALAKGLREAAAARNLRQLLWGSLSARMLYIVGMIMFGCSILTFIMIKIIPAFEKIFKDFGTGLPNATLDLISVSRFIAQYWYVVFPLPFLALLLSLLYSLVKFLGFSTWEPPGLARLTRRKHTAEILDSLAVVVENHRPLDTGLQTLARCYPQSNIRGKLCAVLADVQSGVSWCDSLYRRGLMRKSDWTVLQAAEHAGNLPWAMREIADSSRRRMAYRMSVFVQAIFPPVVLCIGAIVMFIVVALFMPLITLIQRMS